MANFLDKAGLQYFWEKISSKFVLKVDGKVLSSNDFTNDEKAKLAGIAENANNYILPTASADTLGGVKVGSGLSIQEGVLSVTNAGSVDWSGVQNKPTTVAGYGITDAYTKSEIDGKISAVYKPAGSSTFAALPSDLAGLAGSVYNMSEEFTTDERFVEGTGKTYPAGTNIVVTSDSKFDVLSGFVDLSGYLTDDDFVAITNKEIDAIAV